MLLYNASDAAMCAIAVESETSPNLATQPAKALQPLACYRALARVDMSRTGNAYFDEITIA